jgi:hypothetical protein
MIILQYVVSGREKTNSVFLKKLLESAGFSSSRLALVSAFDEELHFRSSGMSFDSNIV